MNIDLKGQKPKTLNTDYKQNKYILKMYIWDIFEISLVTFFGLSYDRYLLSWSYGRRSFNIKTWCPTELSQNNNSSSIMTACYTCRTVHLTSSRGDKISYRYALNKTRGMKLREWSLGPYSQETIKMIRYQCKCSNLCTFI